MEQTLERTCRQCEMLESEAADFCMDDDGRMAHHNWADPRDAVIDELRAENQRLGSDNDWAAKEIVKLQVQNERLRVRGQEQACESCAWQRDALRAENELARTTIDAQSKAVFQVSAENERLRGLGDAVVNVLDDLDQKGFVSKEVQERLRQAARNAWIDLP